MNFQPIQRTPGQDAWDNDHLQFTRLLNKLSEFGVFTPNVRQALSAAFEETPERIGELIQRAELAFDDSLDRYFNEPEEEEEQPIPTTLEEAFKHFHAGNSQQTIRDIKALNEDEFIGLSHSGMGRGIRNAWYLWWSPALLETLPANSTYPRQEPALVKWLRELGLHHADDRSGLLLRAWHRHLNGKPLNLEQQVQAYADYWKNSETDEDTAFVTTTAADALDE